MAEVKPFRALRYAQPTPAVVAPPYDVISPEQRERYLARDPHNVVHLTLPDSEEEAARALDEWRRDGVLVAEPEPALWALEQQFVGPDGAHRSRTGVVASLVVEPYEKRVVLPHERTHAGPKEGPCACCGRPRRSWSRYSCSTRGRRCSPGRAPRRSRPRREASSRGSGASRIPSGSGRCRGRSPTGSC